MFLGLCAILLQQTQGNLQKTITRNLLSDSSAHYQCEYLAASFADQSTNFKVLTFTTGKISQLCCCGDKNCFLHWSSIVQCVCNSVDYALLTVVPLLLARRVDALSPAPHPPVSPLLTCRSCVLPSPTPIPSCPRPVETRCAGHLRNKYTSTQPKGWAPTPSRTSFVFREHSLKLHLEDTLPYPPNYLIISAAQNRRTGVGRKRLKSLAACCSAFLGVNGKMDGGGTHLAAAILRTWKGLETLSVDGRRCHTLQVLKTPAQASSQWTIGGHPRQNQKWHLPDLRFGFFFFFSSCSIFFSHSLYRLTCSWKQ